MTRFVPLAAEHLDGCAALLEARHARHLAAEPLLAHVDDFRAQIEREGGTGVVAVHNGEVSGYLTASLEEDAQLGTRAVVGLAGCAASDPDLVADLYAALAAEWADAGCRRHAVYVPATDDALVHAWFRLAFGCQFVTAVRETAPEEPVEAEVEIRDGTPADLEAVAAFDRLLWELQADAPSFSGLDVDGEDFVQEWSDLWDDASIDLAHAATLPEVRGSGVGVALTAHVLRWAHDHGYSSMTTDWRSVNLLSSRFWPRRGFRPTFLRLYRAIP